MRQYVLDRYHRRRAEWIEKKGGKCVRCGETDGLQFDHIDPATKTFTISKLWSLSNAKIEAELRKCQILCVPCHKDKTRAETTPFSHGTWYAAYNKKCKCDDCASYRRWYNQQRRAKRARPL